MRNLRHKKITFDEAREQMESIAHLYKACHDINYWDFETLPRPLDAPASMVCVYQGRCKKTGITQVWGLDEVDVQAHGSLEALQRYIHKGFAASLVTLGKAVALAEQAQRRIILPQDIQHQGSLLQGYKLLEKGDHDH